MAVRGKLKELCFNSRSREGSDSVYAPELSMGMRFNSRSREGSDIMAIMSVVPETVSIHAPARGATFSDGLR